MLRVNNLVGFGVRDSGKSLIYKDHNRTSGSRASVPSVSSGDLLIAVEHTSSASKSIPSGWTEVAHHAGGTDPVTLIAKVSDGTETGSVAISGDSSPSESMVMSLSISGGISSLGSILDVNAYAGSSNPTAQVKNGSTIGTVPMVIIASYTERFEGDLIDVRTFSGAVADDDIGSGAAWIKWKYYDAGEVGDDITVDMDDEGQNGLCSAIINLNL